MVYLDNAATGGFKPRSVLDCVETTTKYLCANPGRSGHRLSNTGAEIIHDCRCNLAELFDGEPEKVIFTKNCTESLNLAIFGTVVKGGHVITTCFEHNSVLRPLYKLAGDGIISLDVVFPTDDIITQITEKITPATYLIVATAVSNVTGEILPIEKIGELCRRKNILFLCDGAQGGGHIPLSLKKDNINMLALPAHKGLYGIMGAGALIIDAKTEVSPLILGGTGSESFNVNQPTCYPEKLESGTLPLPAISALKEGCAYVKQNISRFSAMLKEITSTAVEKLSEINGIEVYSKPNPAGIVAFNICDIPSTEVADRLNSEYDIAVRGGLHCAPLMHKFLKTSDCGLIRASFAVQNTTQELNFFIRALREIIKSF